jgi:hypothetical protein
MIIKALNLPLRTDDLFSIVTQSEDTSALLFHISKKFEDFRTATRFLISDEVFVQTFTKDAETTIQCYSDTTISVQTVEQFPKLSENTGIRREVAAAEEEEEGMTKEMEATIQARAFARFDEFKVINWSSDKTHRRRANVLFRTINDLVWLHKTTQEKERRIAAVRRSVANTR